MTFFTPIRPEADPIALAALATQIIAQSGLDTSQSVAITATADAVTGLAASKLNADDPSVTNARTPVAHKVTHATGGTDALSPADIGAATAVAVTALATRVGATEVTNTNQDTAITARALASDLGIEATARANADSALGDAIASSATASVVLAPATVGRNRVVSGADNVRPLSLRRFSATATAPSLAVEDQTGATIASISAAGEGFFAKLAVGAAVVSTMGALIVAPAAASQGLVVRGAASQTANLQEWQDSASAVRGFVNSAGQIATTRMGLGALSPASPYVMGIQTIATTDVGLLVKGAASQSGNLQEWQDSNATIVANVGPTGIIRAPSFASVTLSKATLSTNADTGGLLISTNADANKGLVIRGNSGTQTADFIQGQNSGGGINFQLTSAGSARFQGSVTTGASLTIGGTSIGASTGSTTNIGIIARGVASQTADLMQWQDSAATVLAYVTAAGNAYHPRIGVGVAPASTTTLLVQPTANADVAFVARGLASQTGNLTEWQDSTGTAKASINANGQFYVGRTGMGASAPATGRVLALQTAVTTDVGVIIKGAASQTGDLMQFQDSSGANVAQVQSSGMMAVYRAGGANILIGSAPGESFPRIRVFNGSIQLGGGTVDTDTEWARSSAGVHTFKGVNGATGSLVRIVGVASQATSLQEWQDSSATVVGFISATGGAFHTRAGIGASPVSTNALFVQPTVTTDVGLVVKGMASQTGDLIQGQTSAGSIVFLVSASGSARFQSTVTVAASSGLGGSYALGVSAGSTTNIGIVVRGLASQTADLQEWQDSTNAVLAAVLSNGKFITGTAMSLTPAPQLGVNASAANVIGAAIRGAASQTANLTEWQDSAGTVRGFVNSVGQPFFARIGLGSASPNAAATILLVSTSTTNIGAIIRSFAAQTADQMQYQDSTSAVLASVTAAGLLAWNAAANVQTTVGAAGAASALPAAPTKYLKVVDNTGTTLVIPAYAAA